MITSFERLIGAITLLSLGLTIFFSRAVTSSTTYWIEVQYGFSQQAFSLIAIVCGLVLALKPVTRSWYPVLILPYTLYWIASATYIYNLRLAATVPGLLTCLWIALVKPSLADICTHLRGKCD